MDYGAMALLRDRMMYDQRPQPYTASGMQVTPDNVAYNVRPNQFNQSVTPPPGGADSAMPGMAGMMGAQGLMKMAFAGKDYHDDRPYESQIQNIESQEPPTLGGASAIHSSGRMSNMGQRRR